MAGRPLTTKEQLSSEYVHMDIGEKLNLFLGREVSRGRSYIWHEYNDSPSADGSVQLKCGADQNTGLPKTTGAAIVTNICITCEAKSPGMEERVKEANKLIQSEIDKRPAQGRRINQKEVTA